MYTLTPDSPYGQVVYQTPDGKVSFLTASQNHDKYKAYQLQKEHAYDRWAEAANQDPTFKPINGTPIITKPWNPKGIGKHHQPQTYEDRYHHLGLKPRKKPALQKEWEGLALNNPHIKNDPSYRQTFNVREKENIEINRQRTQWQGTVRRYPTLQYMSDASLNQLIVRIGAMEQLRENYESPKHYQEQLSAFEVQRTSNQLYAGVAAYHALKQKGVYPYFMMRDGYDHDSEFAFTHTDEMNSELEQDRIVQNFANMWAHGLAAADTDPHGADYSADKMMEAGDDLWESTNLVADDIDQMMNDALASQAGNLDQLQIQQLMSDIEQEAKDAYEKEHGDNPLMAPASPNPEPLDHHSQQDQQPQQQPASDDDLGVAPLPPSDDEDFDSDEDIQQFFDDPSNWVDDDATPWVPDNDQDQPMPGNPLFIIILLMGLFLFSIYLQK